MVIATVFFNIVSHGHNAKLMIFVAGLKQDGKLIYGQNYSRLVGLKAKYDPDNLFNKSHLGASLLKA